MPYRVFWKTSRFTVLIEPVFVICMLRDDHCVVYLYIEMPLVFQHDWFFGSWDQDDHVPVDEQSETPTNPSVTRLSCDDDGRFYKTYLGEFICQMDL